MTKTNSHTLTLVSLILMVILTFKHALAFEMPEKLTFELTWAGLKAGNATLEAVQSQDSITFKSRAWSADWISRFYYVEDIIISQVQKTSQKGQAMWLPTNYRMKVREGKHRKDRETVFDYSKSKLIYRNYLDNDTTEYDLKGTVYDPLTSFYYTRLQPLEVGKSIFIEMFDSKKWYSLEVQVLAKETITTDLGTFKTVKIKPVMKSDGIFYRKGDILIWLTDDDRRLPVLMKSKVLVGSINATLISVSK